MDSVNFLSALWQGGQYAYYWTAPAKVSYWFQVSKIPQCPNGGQNVYFGVNPVNQIPAKNAQGEPKPPQAVRSQNAYISVLNCLFCEFDFKDFGNTDAIMAHVKKLPLPSLCTFSGGGYHFYYLLKETFSINTDADRERARAAQANWVEFTGGDKQSKDLARVLRVPGTRNYKPQYAPKFPTVTIVKADYSLRYDLSYLEDLSRPAAVESSPLPPLPEIKPKPDDVSYYRQRALNTAVQMIRDAVDGERHGARLRAARLLGGYVAGGIVLESEAIQALEYDTWQASYRGNADIARKTIRDGLNYGIAHPITLDVKLAEREDWLKRNKPEPAMEQETRQQTKKLDRAYWSRKYKGFWEKARV